MKLIVLILALFLTTKTRLMAQSDSIILDLKIIDTNLYNGKEIVVFNNGDWDYLSEISIKTIAKGETKSGKLFFSYESLVGSNFKTTRTTLNQLNCRKASDSITVNTSGFISPVKAKCNSSFKIRDGRWHQGNDYATSTGTLVVSAWPGIVRYAQYNNGGYGNLVIIRHYNGLETYYAHLSKIDVKPYDTISAGKQIGKVGSTGHSTGPHLHFEVRFFDCPVNPSLFSESINEVVLSKSNFPANSEAGESFAFKEKLKITETTESKVVVVTSRKRKTFTTIK